MKQRKKIKWTIIILVVIIFPNLSTSINETVLNTVDINHFRYSNANASFTYIEKFSFKSGAYHKQSMTSWIDDMNLSKENQEVFRLYKINPLCFWRWRYYWTVSREFRYKSWKEIEPGRVPYNPNPEYYFQRF